MTAQENQTLFDIALVAYGDANAAFELARTNNISVSDILQDGQNIILPEIDQNTLSETAIKARAEYRNANIQPATGDTQTRRLILVKNNNENIVITTNIGIFITTNNS